MLTLRARILGSGRPVEWNGIKVRVHTIIEVDFLLMNTEILEIWQNQLETRLYDDQKRACGRCAFSRFGLGSSGGSRFLSCRIHGENHT